MRLRVSSHERRNELIPVCNFKPAWKQVLFTWSFSWSVYMIFYHPKRNFISVKMTDMKSIPALTFKRTCALIATSNESALIHFALGKLCSHENLMPVWNSFWSKWPIWSPYRFEFHFASAHVKTSKELTEHWSENFNRNEIPYRFEFILPLMWTYSKCD